jgi:hypothetical protein
VGLPSSTASPFDLLAESSEGEEAFRVVDEDLVLSSRARFEHESMVESGEHPLGVPEHFPTLQVKRNRPPGVLKGEDFPLLVSSDAGLS